MKINRINLLLFLLFSCHYIDYDPGGEAPPKGRITLEADYQDLVASELSFADFTENNNIRDGFLAFMADDGIIYRGEFVNAKAYYEPLTPTSTVLSWRPEVAGISRSGDLGCGSLHLPMAKSRGRRAVEGCVRYRVGLPGTSLFSCVRISE